MRLEVKTHPYLCSPNGMGTLENDSHSDAAQPPPDAWKNPALVVDLFQKEICGGCSFTKTKSRLSDDRGLL